MSVKITAKTITAKTIPRVFVRSALFAERRMGILCVKYCSVESCMYIDLFVYLYLKLAVFVLIDKTFLLDHVVSFEYSLLHRHRKNNKNTKYKNFQKQNGVDREGKEIQKRKEQEKAISSACYIHGHSRDLIKVKEI